MVFHLLNFKAILTEIEISSDFISPDVKPDLNKTGVCPFEKVAAYVSHPEESYVVFKDLLEKMKQRR